LLLSKKQYPLFSQSDNDWLAYPNQRDYFGGAISALELAVNNNDPTVLNMLLKHKIKMPFRHRKTNMTIDLQTLSLPKTENAWECLKHLINATPNKDRDPRHIYRFYEAAVQQKQEDIQTFLSDLNILDPLHCALLKKNQDLIRQLVSQKTTSISEINHDYQTPMQVAAKNQQWEIVKTIAQSRKTNSEDHAGYDDALIEAMRAKEYEIAKLLIMQGAPLQRYDRSSGSIGYSALHFAVRDQQYDLIALLLSKKKYPLFTESDNDRLAYPNQRYLNGRISALELASKLETDNKTDKSRTDLVNFLSSYQNKPTSSSTKLRRKWEQITIPSTQTEWGALKTRITKTPWKKQNPQRIYLRFYQAAIKQNNKEMQNLLMLYSCDPLLCTLVSNAPLSLDEAKKIQAVSCRHSTPPAVKNIIFETCAKKASLTKYLIAQEQEDNPPDNTEDAALGEIFYSILAIATQQTNNPDLASKAYIALGEAAYNAGHIQDALAHWSKSDHSHFSNEQRERYLEEKANTLIADGKPASEYAPYLIEAYRQTGNADTGRLFLLTQKYDQKTDIVFTPTTKSIQAALNEYWENLSKPENWKDVQYHQNLFPDTCKTYKIKLKTVFTQWINTQLDTMLQTQPSSQHGSSSTLFSKSDTLTTNLQKFRSTINHAKTDEEILTSLKSFLDDNAELLSEEQCSFLITQKIGFYQQQTAEERTNFKPSGPV